jgi:hypothetical protein
MRTHGAVTSGAHPGLLDVGVLAIDGDSRQLATHRGGLRRRGRDELEHGGARFQPAGSQGRVLHTGMRERQAGHADPRREGTRESGANAGSRNVNRYVFH